MTDPERDECPFLVPVTADRIWIFPVAAYCRRPGHAIRVPGTSTFASVCTRPEHCECEGYRTALAESASTEPPPRAAGP